MAIDFPAFQRNLTVALTQAFGKKTLDAFGRILVKRIRETTDRGQSIANPDGKVTRLAKLKESTKKQKRRKGLPTRSRLRETGAMMKDLSFKTNVRNQTVTVSNRSKKQRDKAQFATEGSVSPDREPRPFIPTGDLDRKTEKQIEKALERGITKALRKLQL